MLLRPADPGDALAVARLHVRAWQVAYRGLLPQDYLDAMQPEDRAARYTFNRLGGPQTTVAVGDDEVVCGFVTTARSRDGDAADAGEVQAIYVDPSAWGTGAGRLLIGAGRQALVDAGFVDALLWVLSGNERAHAFYRRDGWHADGSQRHEDVHGVPADVVRFRRALP